MTTSKIRYGRAAQARVLMIMMVICLAVHQAAEVFLRPQGLDPESVRLSALLVLAASCVAAILALARQSGDRAAGLWNRLLDDPARSMRIISLATFACGAVAASIAPTWNDERFNIEAAQVLIDRGLTYYLANYGSLSPWLSPHHPPLLASAYGLIFKATGSSLFWGRLFGLAFFIGAQRMTWLLGSELFNRRIGVTAAACLLLFPLVIFEAPTALFDMPFLFFFLTALLMFIRTLRGAGWPSAALAALAVGLGSLTRYNMIFIYPILAVLLIQQRTRRPWRNPRVWLATLGPAVVALPWAGYLLISDVGRLQLHRLAGYILVAFLPEGGPEYVSEALLPVFPIHLGVFLIPPLVHGCMVARRDIRMNEGSSSSSRFVLWWILILTALTCLTIPHVRYLLPALPALAMAMALGLEMLGAGGGSVYALGLFCSIATAVVYDLLTHFGLVYIFY